MAEQVNSAGAKSSYEGPDTQARSVAGEATPGALLPEPHFTPDPWEWWTSNSWRRLKRRGAAGLTTDVLTPTVQGDGQPDVIVSGWDMGLIGAAPDMFLALRMLYEETVEYFQLNNLGDAHHNQSVRMARAALLKALTRVER